MKYLVTKLLSDATVEHVHQLLQHSNWEDGLVSVNFRENVSDDDKYRIKKNYQTTIPNDVLFPDIDICNDFLDFIVPKSTTPPLITKTPTGGYYKPHFDFFDNGHFSTTIFLNSPKDYDGGELCLLIDGEETKFKLDPGYGVVYETGTVHRVNTVTKGERIVCVLWSKTLIPDMNELYRYRYYKKMAARYPIINDPCDTCQEFSDDMNIHFTEKAHKILRKWI